MDKLEMFRKEVEGMLTSDIELILNDQKDLYTEEEFAILQSEYEKRPKTKEEYENDKLEIIKENEKEFKLKLEEEILKNEETKKEKINNLKKNGIEEYYEYTSLEIIDDDDGRVDVEYMISQINELALEGWKLISAFANELGKNTSSVGIYGFASGKNATIEQNILIFERKIKI